MKNAFIDQLRIQLDNSPSPHHAVLEVSEQLLSQGFSKVPLQQEFPNTPGNYFLTHQGALVAWIQQKKLSSYRIVGAHTDSPNLRVRPNPDATTAGYKQLLVEIYGSPLLNSWLDRDLGVAGEVFIETANGTQSKTFKSSKPVLRIPQLAIHLDRSLRTEGLKLNPQQHLSPIWGFEDSSSLYKGFKEYIAKELSIPAKSIIDWELMAFDLQPSALLGDDDLLLSSSRIDNLLSVFCGSEALSHTTISDTQETVPVLALFDYEEVGSSAITGAQSNFLPNILERIAISTGLSREKYLQALTNSFAISADGAHATHPNYPEKHEPAHNIFLNKGIAIKYNANQRYATTGDTAATIRSLLKTTNIPSQYFSSRNDMPCGSTIGPMLSSTLSIPTVDLGVPQLAMHSIRETAGITDILSLVELLKKFWEL